MSRLIIFLCMFCLSLAAMPQNSKQIKDLKSKRSKIEQNIKQQKEKLQQKRHETVKKEQTADFLQDQLKSRLQYINRLEREIDTLNAWVNRLQAELDDLNSQLNVRKQKYIQSLRAARQSTSVRNPVLFIFSAESFPQIYRRMRYAREFASLQKNLGVQVMDKQQQVQRKQNELLGTKQQLSAVMQEVIVQRRQLASQHSVVRANVAQLRKQQKEIEQQVAQQQKQLNELNKKIDELVAYEIEQARKRAEAEARRKREAELAAQQKNKGAKGKSEKGKSEKAKSEKAPSKWLTAEDRQLNGNLEQNKGRLPVPITGPYRIARRFGINQIATGIILDNKGVNYMGQEGARARAIFDGEVSAVFQLGNLKNVLVRHGSYISVYCNLSSTIVVRGQKVKARDILGTVAEDEQGNRVLHFQLRKETAKLNPESWIGR